MQHRSRVFSIKAVNTEVLRNKQEAKHKRPTRRSTSAPHAIAGVERVNPLGTEPLNMLYYQYTALELYYHKI